MFLQGQYSPWPFDTSAPARFTPSCVRQARSTSEVRWGGLAKACIYIVEVGPKTSTHQVCLHRQRGITTAGSVKSNTTHR